MVGIPNNQYRNRPGLRIKNRPMSSSVRDNTYECNPMDMQCVTISQNNYCKSIVEQGRLRLALDVRDWPCRCEAMAFLPFVPITNAMAVESVRLPEFPHAADPADWIIAATALSLGAALVTKDGKLRNYPHVNTIW